MGLFDLGDMFDFNGDGKTDASEEFMAYMMFEEMQKENSEDNPDALDDLNDLSEDETDDFEYSPPTYIPARSHSPAVVPRSSSGSDKAETPESEPPKAITLEEYRRTRNGLIHASIAQLLVGLLLCAIPGLVIYAAFVTYDPKVSASRLVSFLFGIGGFVFLCIIAKVFVSAVVENVAEIRDSKEQYYLSLSPEEKDARRSRKKKARWIVVTALGIIVIAVISIVSVNESNTAAIYHDAEELIAVGKFDDAKTVLEGIKDKEYHDTEALIKLCTAHNQFNSGRSIDAFYTLKDVRFSYISQEQRSEINDFQQTLQSEYDAYIKKQAERAQAEYEHTQSLPFPSVGQYVTQSQLAGMTREGKDNKTFDVSTTKYVCVVGTKKYRLWITDYNCIKKVVELSSGRTSSSSSGKSGSSSIGTGPSVDGFSDPADFYEWFWDDFVDFEDAEEYYYSHGGK